MLSPGTGSKTYRESYNNGEKDLVQVGNGRMFLTEVSPDFNICNIVAVLS